MKSSKKLVFVSNYFNHHQEALADEFYKQLDDAFVFIETVPFEQERKNIGWEEKSKNYLIKSFVSNETRKESIQIINEAEVVIFGAADDIYVNERLKQGKLTFKYSERIFKNTKEKAWSLIHKNVNWAENKKSFLLCASAYALSDFKKCGLFNETNSFVWGYFPATFKYDIDRVLPNKQTNKIIWCGRIIKWKHLELAINVVNKLQKDGIKAELDIIGDGHLKKKMEKYVEKLKLKKSISFLGSLSNIEVRQKMLLSGIFLMTSDFNEGWGVVLNEAMNSGCACVVSHAVGSAPFLIVNKNNGLIFKNRSADDAYLKIKKVILNIKYQKEIGKNAYKTITEYWSPQMAASAFFNRINAINEKTRFNCDGIICSSAPLIHNNWFLKNENNE